MKSPAFLLFLLWTLSLYADEKWPGVKYSEVRAYAWPAELETKGVILDGMKLLKGVKNPEGTMLSAAQIQRLLSAVTGEHEAHRVAACYSPRHAFVFYDGDKPVAYYEICFSCGGFDYSPKGAGKWNDVIALATLFDELKLFGEFDLERYKKRTKEIEKDDRKSREEYDKSKK